MEKLKRIVVEVVVGVVVIQMKLKCEKCNHVWDTKKDDMPKMCPYCKCSTYYHKPLVLKK